MKMTSIYTTHPQYVEHQIPGYSQHPEHPGRIEAVWQTFEDAGLQSQMQQMTPQAATDEMLLRVHTQKHLDLLKYVAGQDRLAMIDADTYALPVSERIARLSAGGVIGAVEAVAKQEAPNALAAVRPPGHHATPDRAMGFCLLNNVAVAVRHAQALYNIKRVLIVDFDVHHGNGTQDAFYSDDSVLFISTHQHPFYPGTGAINDIGQGPAKGTTINIPLSQGQGDTNYMRIFREIIWPAARRFQPQLILVSAGFDAHFVDPLASMRLSLQGYAQLCRELLQMANELCGGKIVFVMEGGYDLQALGHGMRNIAHVLLGQDHISDPYGLDSAKEPDVQPVLEEIKAIHQL